jgi:DNA polymerase III subunit epsilon
METLKLAYVKPLAFIKIQTTGLNPTTDRIIELSITRVDTDGKTKTGTRLVNPEMPIPAEVTKINGITDEQVKSKPAFKEIAENISKFLEGCDFVGFNISFFDLRFLSEEFNRAGVEFTLLGRKVVDLANIYHGMEPRDLTAAYAFYCGKNVEGKPASQQTTEMYFEIINKMMEKYSGNDFTDKEGKTHKIEATVDSINTLFNKNKNQLDLDGFIVLNADKKPAFTKGKYKDQVVADVLRKDEEYYKWLIDASSFPADTKIVIKKIFEKAKASAALGK